MIAVIEHVLNRASNQADSAMHYINEKDLAATRDFVAGVRVDLAEARTLLAALADKIGDQA